MINSIYISKTIYKLLSENEELAKYIDGKIYPLVAENSTTFPFIIYYRDSLNCTKLTKDGYNSDNATFIISVVSNKYIESLEIANIVRKIFSKNVISGDDIEISNIELEVDEDWNNAYIQTLTFNCTIENK